MPTKPEKVIIIGSGPAGWTAAIYAARAKLEPLVYEGAISQENHLRGTLPLGQLNLTTEVENFPGFPKGISGPDLMLAMRQQAEHQGTRIVTQDIVEVDLQRRPFALKDSEGNALEAHALIIATGASANYLGLDSEGTFKNRGVSACAVCDGALPRFRNRPLVVVGGGRQRGGGGDVPHQVRQHGLPGAPAGQAAGEPGDGRARAGQPEGQSRLELGGAGSARRR